MPSYPQAVYCQHKGQQFNLLSKTQAMQCWSFPLPALWACPGAVHGCDDEGNVSTCDTCYARQGRQCMPSVAGNSGLRLAFVRSKLRTRSGRVFLADRLVDSINATTPRGGYFRWFDSGDVMGYWMARVIENVILRTPHVKHWVPTRIWHVKRMRDAMTVLRRINALPNAVVRPSALYVDSPAPRVSGLAEGTEVPTEPGNESAACRLCPKTTMEDQFDADGRKITPTCVMADCRKCWDEPHVPVGYLVHGPGGNHVVSTDHEKGDAIRLNLIQIAASL